MTHQLEFFALFGAAALLCGCCSSCPSSGPRDFGTTKYGEKAHLYTLRGKGGLTMEVTDYGGRVNRLLVPDADGKLTDVTIGFSSPAGWDTIDPYYGAIIGRFGNRIANGVFTLDGKTYKLELSDPDHHACLHGGKRGFHGYVWDAKPFEKGDDVGIVFSRVSPDGEDGFPGTVDVKVTYTITPENVWRIEYNATTDAATPFNMTQHCYFNLDADDTILDEELQLVASRYSPVNADLAPVGPAAPVEGTPFDFREFHAVGERINDPDTVLQYGPGYDHNWVVDGEGFRRAATLRGRTHSLEVWSDQPCIQFYAGNFIPNGGAINNGRELHHRGFLALETQHYPDSPNRPDFPSTILRPGETYKTVTEYRFK